MRPWLDLSCRADPLGDGQLLAFSPITPSYLRLNPFNAEEPDPTCVRLVLVA